MEAGEQSRRAIEALGQGAPVSRQILEQILADAARWKPGPAPGMATPNDVTLQSPTSPLGSGFATSYDAHQLRRRHYYEGKVVEYGYARMALERRFASTWRQMPQVAPNFVRLVASVDASVYDHPVKRALEVDGEVLPEGDERNQSLTRLTRDARLHVVLPETERRLMVSYTQFLRVGWDALGRCPQVQAFWPHDVFVIPHERFPHDLRYACALVARIAGPSGASPTADETWWELWTRAVESEDPTTGAITFSRWHVDHVNGRGDSRQPFASGEETGAASNTYPLETLPWVVWHAGIPEGTVFLDVDRDLLDVADCINVGWSNVLHTIDMNAHSETVYAGDSVQKTTLVGGPGAVHKIGDGESLTPLSFDPKLDAMLLALDRQVKTLAVTRRQSPDAYATERGAPLSGVSRRVANEPQDKARKERQEYARAMEMQLLDVLCEVGGYWGADKYGTLDVAEDAGASSFVVTFTDPPDFEDPEQMSRRMVDMVNAGMISKARAAVLLGFYKDEGEAQAGLDQIQATKPPPPPAPAPPTSRLAAKLSAALDRPAQSTGGPKPPTPPPGA